MYLEVIAVLHYNNNDGDIHACVLKAYISAKYSKCISAIKRILYSTAMHISSSSFVYLWFSLFCDACLKSSVLRVGMKTSHNTTILKKERPATGQNFVLRWGNIDLRIVLPDVHFSAKVTEDDRFPFL